MGGPSVASRLFLKLRSTSFPCGLPAQCGRYTARHHSVLFEHYPSQCSSRKSRRHSLRLALHDRLPQETLEAFCEPASRVYRREGGARAAANTPVYHDLQRGYDSGYMLGNTCGGLQNLPQTICQSRDLGNIFDGCWRRVLCFFCRPGLR